MGSGFLNDTENATVLSTLQDPANPTTGTDTHSIPANSSIYVYYDVVIVDSDRTASETYTNTATANSLVDPNNGTQQGNEITDTDTANVEILPTGGSAASLSGFTYLDLDNDGVKDADEPGIAGVEIEITNGTQTLTATTDLTGAYLFTELTGGTTYTITQTQPKNYFDGKDTAGTGGGTADPTAGSNEISSVSVTTGNYYENYNFGEILPASIGGVAYIDSIDDNGTPLDNSDDFAGSDQDRQDTEAGRAGILVTLSGTNDFEETVNLTTTTDSSGRYYFGDLRPSDGLGYTIDFGDGTDLGVVGSGDIGTITDILGGTSSVGTAGSNDDITGIVLGAGENGTNYDFGLPAGNVGGVISGTVYEDRGIYTSGVLGGTDDGLITDSDSSSTLTTPSTGEKRISGVTIELYDSSNNLVATTTTDINGNYSFTNLPDGTYEVREVQPQYYDPSANDGDGGFVDYLDGQDARDNTVITENSDTISNLVISGGNNLIGNNFGELPPASISGYVFLDLLNTKQFALDGGESLRNSDALPTVEYLQGTVVGGNNSIVDVNNTGTDPVIYSVDVRNGEFDDDEFGIAGVTLRLYASSDLTTLLDETTTDADGYYRFDGLASGDYTVIQVQPSDYEDGIYNFDADSDFSRTEVLPGNILGVQEGQYNDPGYNTGTEEDNFSSIVLNYGQSGVDYNFPEALPAAKALITGTVYEDSNLLTGSNDNSASAPIYVNDPGIAGVTIELYSGATLVDSTTTDADGNYSFSVDAGSYTIQEIQPTNYDNGTENSSNSIAVSVAAGETSSNNDFGEVTSSISGFVLFDTDGDSSTTTNDQSGLSNITVRLLDSGGTEIATTLTQFDGSYEFTGLLAGTYTIEQVDNGDYSDASPEIIFSGSGTLSPNSNGNNDRISTITLNADENLTNYNFYETTKNEVTGTGASEVINTATTIATTTGDDIITANKGQDTLTGGGGNDCFHLNETSDGIDIILDFNADNTNTTDRDFLDFRDIAAGELNGVTVTNNLFDDGYINAKAFGSHTMIQVDVDGVDDIYDKNVVLLVGVSAGDIDASDFIF